jgi:dTDP-glucose 4,6-dehydratase
MKKNLLVTGGCGFIGSAFIKQYINSYKDSFIINVDSLTYAGDLENTKEFSSLSNYKHIKADIQDYSLMKHLISEYQINYLVNFAAESHVDRSIKNPDVFLQSNINGTLQLLKACYETWMEGPNHYKSNCRDNVFLQVSTDEVYGTLQLSSQDASFTETSNYLPNSPYSASKAGAELFIRSFSKTYGLNVLTTSCSNNYGERQNEEKLIPHVITQSLLNKDISIHGEGKNIRDWLYVEDHCEAIIAVLHSNASSGSKYNIGGGDDSEKNNIEVVNAICECMDQLHPMNGNRSYKSLIRFVKDRPGNDLKYSVDISKIKRDLNWEPTTSFDVGLKKVVQWYIDRFQSRKTPIC